MICHEKSIALKSESDGTAFNYKKDFFKLKF